MKTSNFLKPENTLKIDMSDITAATLVDIHTVLTSSKEFHNQLACARIEQYMKKHHSYMLKYLNKREKLTA